MDGGNMETIGVTILLLGLYVVLSAAFELCMGLSTHQPARVNDSNHIPHRIKDDSLPYIFPYACPRLSRLRNTLPPDAFPGQERV